ncbi:MAG: M81 family metallopeptidase [Planctomycetaceae bacterium]|nr:M81 family metallopeptidase [Planctomycetaceae bacterium]MCB9950758.1 M81 family metallopeptidase [Planctomycetaceae bacterium]
MRIGLIALLHESNTFSHQPTTLESFRQNLLLTGEPIRQALADAHHEVGGFFAGLDEAGAEAVPLFAARALPSGTIAAADFDTLVSMMLAAVRAAGKLDGILVAPHGATVSENFPDADGHWLSVLRKVVGDALPIIGTLDAHANLSPLMVDSCDALVAYRTNPHLDQRARGIEAARLMVQTVRGEISPVMAAAYPPMAISIDRQCTDEPHLKPLYSLADEKLKAEGVLSNSILLGFPYADVAEMGSAVIAVTNGDNSSAQRVANQLAENMWSIRYELAGEFTSVDDALTQCADISHRICLLDMGDNVGGGSAADGTELLAALHERRLGPAFGCIYDPASVQACEQAGVGQRVRLTVGGKTDNLHGSPIDVEVTVRSLCDGKFTEPQPRHGGIREFDQGRTAICETDAGLTLMLTSLRMVPFSLQQLYSCGVDPRQFRLLVAKGVNAPIAAYRDVCEQFIRVNTLGSTCADMSRLTYEHRRRPLFPLEQDAVYSQGIST